VRYRCCCLRYHSSYSERSFIEKCWHQQPRYGDYLQIDAVAFPCHASCRLHLCQHQMSRLSRDRVGGDGRGRHYVRSLCCRGARGCNHRCAHHGRLCRSFSRHHRHSIPRAQLKSWPQSFASKSDKSCDEISYFHFVYLQAYHRNCVLCVYIAAPNTRGRFPQRSKM
jgi:hypothetical protein